MTSGLVDFEDKEHPVAGRTAEEDQQGKSDHGKQKIKTFIEHGMYEQMTCKKRSWR